MLLLATPVVRLVCPLHVLSFVAAARGGESASALERSGTCPARRGRGAYRGPREPPGGRRLATKTMGAEPDDRSRGPRTSRETARRVAERVGFEPTDRLRGQRFSRPPHSTTLAPLPVRQPSGVPRILQPRNGGEGGIRTHGRVAPTHAFQACTFDHSVTSPYRFDRPLDRRCRKNERNNAELSSARTPEHTVIR